MNIARLPQIAAKLLNDPDSRRELKRRLNVLSNGGYTQIFERLPIFVPTSGGPARDLANLTLTAAQNSFPLLVEISNAIGEIPLVPISQTSFCDDAESQQRAKTLGDLFEKYGSDKTFHGYHYIYGKVLAGCRRLLEIGMGTNNEDVVSTMGKDGKPGASLRAFRDFLPGADIFGADIDGRIMFSERRIRTFVADQTNLQSLKEIPGAPFDIIIDDGLHTVDANLNVLLFAAGTLREKGWLIVEDILPEALPVWQIVSILIPNECHIIKTPTSLVFTMRRS